MYINKLSFANCLSFFIYLNFVQLYFTLYFKIYFIYEQYHVV